MGPVVLVDVLDTCGTCGDPAPPGATTCECGERLAPRPVRPVPVPHVIPYGCTCLGAGTCQACIFYSYEGGAT